MRFYRLDEVPKSSDDRVFKESPVTNAIAALILFGLAAGAFYLGITHWQPSSGHMAPYAPYFVGAILALIGLFPLFNLRAALKPSNWLLRANLTGVFLNYRGYENWRLPSDKVHIVGIEYGEIAWAKIVKERRITPAMGANRSNQVDYHTFIDLGLAKSDTSELEAHISEEQNLRPDGRLITLDYPVQVRSDGIVEIHWTVGIRPSAHEALKVLGQRVKILETEHRSNDLTYRLNADPGQEKANILALAKSGDEIGAAKLAQQAYGCSLSDATNMVEKLPGREDD